MRLRNILLMLAVSALAALGLAACGGGDDEGTTTTGEGASVSFTEPTDGATTGSTLTANVEVSGFEIDAAAVGKANEEGKGHLHFSMDRGKYDYPKYSGANGKLAEKLGVEGKYSPSTEPTITYKGLPTGKHTLEVDLVNNDHSETGTSATTTFEVTSSGSKSGNGAKSDSAY